MKRIFEFISKHQAGVLSISLASLVSASVIALMESFNHLA